MICPDIFEFYDKSKDIKSDYFNLNLKDFNKDLFDSYLVYYIENKDPKRIEKIKKYINFGYDINEKISKLNIHWIELAIIHNDIPLIGFLVKSNADIHITDSNGINIIFKCVLNKNEVLLKYFLNLGVNPNILNKDKDTPLSIACIMKNGFECAKILLESSSIQIDILNQEIPIIELVIDNIDNGNKNYLQLLDIILKKKNKLSLGEIKLLRTSVYYGDLDIVKVFVNNFPNIINKSSDDEDKNTIVHMALHENHEEMLKYFFTFKNLDYTKTNKEDITYLEYLCGYQMYDLLDLFCKKYPKSLDLTYTNSQGIIESVILTYDFDTVNDKEIESIKKIIKILISNGADINFRNDSEYTPIFPSIQYSNAAFVSFMIEQGANIKDNLKRNSEFPPVSNNDPISFAIQLNKYEIFKILIESGSLLHQIEINGLKYYTSVLISLKYKRQQHFNYLINNIPEITKWLKSNELIINYLFDYCIKNGCMDELILREIVPESKIKTFDFTDPICNISHNEKKISICIEEYKNTNDKLTILNGLLETIRILLKLSTINHKNYSSFFGNFENLYGDINDAINSDEEIKNIHNNFYDWVDSFIHIICDKINYYNMHNVKKIFEYVFKIYWEIPDDDEDANSNIKLNVFNPKHYTKKINILYKLLESKKNIIEDYEKEVLLIIDKQKNISNNTLITSINKKSLGQDVVIKKLFKLFWPMKQPHYEYMYHSIVKNNDKIINKSNKTNIIILSENKIKSTIFYNSHSCIPQRWIKTYAPNIGKEEKSDQNHMFSFLLDTLLEKYTCIQIETKDPNHNGTNLLCYFYGMLEFNGDIETGCYEYFINSNGTLFHRMFRPWDFLSNNIKKMIKN